VDDCGNQTESDNFLEQLESGPVIISLLSYVQYFYEESFSLDS